MALKEKTSSIGLSNASGGNFAMNIGELQGAEVTEISKIFDTTGYYKMRKYNVTFEESTYSDGSMVLPTAVTMTGKKDVYLQIKLKNANKQSAYIGFEVPHDSKSATELEAFVNSFKGVVLAGFGAVDSVSYVLKNVK